MVDMQAVEESNEEDYGDGTFKICGSIHCAQHSISCTLVWMILL